MAMTSGTPPAAKKTVGFIGLGIMGGGMVGRLLDHGFAVTVWNRTAAKAAPLVARGARLAASPAEATATANVVVLIIRDDASVRDVLLGSGAALAAARPGATFINMTTTTPGLGRDMEAAATARGCAFLDAPVAGSRVAAATGKLAISVSGKAETRCLPAPGPRRSTTAGQPTILGWRRDPLRICGLHEIEAHAAFERTRRASQRKRRPRSH